MFACASFVSQFVWVFFPPLCRHVTYMEINDFLAVPDPLSLNEGRKGCSQMPTIPWQHAGPTHRLADCDQGIPHRMDPTQASIHCLHTHTEIGYLDGSIPQTTWYYCLRLQKGFPCELTPSFPLLKDMKNSKHKKEMIFQCHLWSSSRCFSPEHNLAFCTAWPLPLVKCLRSSI